LVVALDPGLTPADLGKAGSRSLASFALLRESIEVTANGSTLHLGNESGARLGHSAPAAALRYQQPAAGRDKQIAAALSELAQV
jgi:hypothetical protein